MCADEHVGGTTDAERRERTQHDIAFGRLTERDSECVQGPRITAQRHRTPPGGGR